MHVLILPKENENNFISSLIDEDIFLGISNFASNSGDPIWRQSSGTRIEYFNWDKNEPNDWDDNQRIVVLRRNGKWDDNYVTKYKHILCAIKK